MMSSSQQPHNLEYQKFLQMLLNNDQSRSQESGGFPYYIICAMHFLYFLDPKEQSKASMMTPKILQFYSGTYNPADRLILEIIYSLDASVNISSEMRIESYSFPQEQKKLYNFAVGHCEMSFSSKVFRNSIKTLSNKSGAYSYQKFETVMEYIAVIEKFTDSQEQDLVYDPLFVLPAIADMVSRKLVSVNSMVDSHCLSYVVICLGLNARVAGMARKILNSSISLIDESHYKEKDLTRTTLYSLYYATSDPTLIKNPRFSIILTIIANMIPILSNVGHFLFDRVLQYVTKSPTIDTSDIPLLRTLLPASEVDNYGKATNWMLNMLISSMKRCSDLTIYEDEFIFEIVQTIQSVSTSWDSTRALSSALLSHARLQHNLDKKPDA
ncbi:uncharacterized protein V2V93DRAFT_327878 [Kockiozyma suomiensis]|uniref:uncharacterized protein n=1 Tax=Kockiozyma suomiensis TaxID=1337062 RepID=UPI0033437D7F